ncbi:MAG: ATP-binding protein, partial [Gammaproteobacteria bacterium]
MTPLRRYLTILPIIGTAVFAAYLMEPYFDRTNVVMVYMLAVVLAAFLLGWWPAAVVCLLSVVLYDFINVPPYFRLSTEFYVYLFTLATMLITAGTISMLAGRLRQEVQASEEREARTAAQYALSAALAKASSEQDIFDCATRHIRQAFRAHPTADNDDDDDTDTTNGITGQLALPSLDPGQPPLILPIAIPAARLSSREQRDQLQAMLQQCRDAIERLRLNREVYEKDVRIQKESLRNSILNTLSHDLRTPLAAILGASSSLLEGDSFTPESRQQLRTVIHDEATHMMSLVENLLNMAKLQGGDFTLSSEWEAIEELVGSAVSTIRRRHPAQRLEVDVPTDLPFIRCDSVLIERVLINLMENAVKFSPPDAPIRLIARHAGTQLEIIVADEGRGIPEDERQKVFEPFYRLDTSVAGGGLGLSICRSIIQAHGGAIWIAAAATGTAMHITLPVPQDA